jgi:hypothetical protein
MLKLLHACDSFSIVDQVLLCICTAVPECISFYSRLCAATSAARSCKHSARSFPVSQVHLFTLGLHVLSRNNHYIVFFDKVFIKIQEEWLLESTQMSGYLGNVLTIGCTPRWHIECINPALSMILLRQNHPLLFLLSVSKHL